MADFDRIANSYNILKKIVFQNHIDTASKHFLKLIPAKSRILIIGGGTGDLLSEFNSSHRIKYIELSNSMIQKAKRIESEATIEFIEADILRWRSDEQFDYIVTPFILDCFNENELSSLLPTLRANLLPNGTWIHTDFYPKNTVQRSLIAFMYLFFRITTKLTLKEIADFDVLFKSHKFLCERKAVFYHSMVESKIYRKIE